MVKQDETNKSFPNKPVSGRDNVTTNIGGNRDFEEKGLDAVIHSMKKLCLRNKWDSFSGKKNEDPKSFLTQFLEVEDSIDSNKLLAIVKSRLGGLALRWFEALEGDELNDYEEFKHLFRERFCREEIEEDRLDKFMHLYVCGPKMEGLLCYAYELKKFAPRNPEFMQRSFKAIRRFVPQSLESMVENVGNWPDMFLFFEKHEAQLSWYLKKSSKKSSSAEPSDNHFKMKVVGKEPVVKNCMLTFTVESNSRRSSADNRPKISLKGENVSIEALIDTGAQSSLISASLAHKLGLKLTECGINVFGVGGMTKVKGAASFLVKKPKRKKLIEVKAYVVENLTDNLILGIEEIRGLGLTRYIDHSTIVSVSTSNEVKSECSLRAQESETVDAGFGDLSKVDRESLNKVIRRYWNVFIGHNEQPSLDLEHAIELTADFSYVKNFTRKRSPQDHELIREKVNEFLSKGLIEESRAGYTSPVTLVRKKDSSIRFCIDYRRLNAITKKEIYPIPLVEETLDCIGSAKFFSVLDLESGYHQVNVKLEDRYKTAFKTREGTFQWIKMPFGLTNAPFTFQRLMNSVFKKQLYRFVLVYLDDILIFSNTFESHLKHLEIVLKSLEVLRLKANRQKCKLCKDSVLFLGYQISKDGMTIPLQQQSRGLQFKTPGTKKELQSFIGFTVYFRKFIKNYTKTMLPLYKCTEKGKFQMSKEAIEACDVIRKVIGDGPCLKLPDFNRPFILYTDASNFVIGGALMQKYDEEELPVFFISRKLNSADINYTVTEKECLAVVWCIKSFKTYLSNEFVIETDHQALKWLLNLKEDASGRLMRWILTLQQFSFKVHYIKGSENTLADGLTRVVGSVRDSVSNEEEIDTTQKNEIIFKNHSECGHGGTVPTYILVLRTHRWRGMYADIHDWIKRCEVCCRFNKKRERYPLQRISLDGPFSRVGIDVVGPLPKSENGNRFLVVATDFLTRWCEARAIKNKSAKSIALFIIEEIFCRHGPPSQLLSDQGLEFLNKTVQQVCKMLNTKKTSTSSYHPQCNGTVERTNQTLIAKLAKFTDGRWEEWDNFLYYALFAYRISVRTVSKRSPFELLYGRPPNPLDFDNERTVIP
ncbi:MAG: reverse transcriptase domain-containing protein, partial [Clostridium sp.]|uniref:reverse transcriptase domain-containing protein n=1 Tax=Clostridium sp. TaxID=1506 RepID=UPI003F32492E